MLLDWKYNPATKSWTACSKLGVGQMWKIDICSDGHFRIMDSDKPLLGMLKDFGLDNYTHSTLLEAQLVCLSGDLTGWIE